MALSEQLRESANTPEAVLSEVSAAMAVLASDGRFSLPLPPSLPPSLSLSLTLIQIFSLFMLRAGEEADHGTLQWPVLQDPHQIDGEPVHRGPIQLCRGHRSPGHQP